MLFITGDMHADPTMVRIENMAHKREMLMRSPRTDPLEKSHLLMVGDFGYCWHGLEALLKTLSDRLREYNTFLYFIDGNHEDFDLLYSYPIDSETQMRPVCDNIFHLQRGMIYTIDGRTIFTFGGADSVDKAKRTPGYSWWVQEAPTTREWLLGENCLESYDGKLDYIMTHDAPKRILDTLVSQGVMRSVWDCSGIPRMLDNFMYIAENKFPGARWFFGHHHIDIDLFKDAEENSLNCRYTGIFRYVTYLQ